MILRKRKKVSKENVLQDKVAGKVAAGILKFQTVVSNKMNKVKNLKLFMIGFCFLSGSLSVYFFVTAIVAKPKDSVRIDRVKMPVHLNENGNEVLESPVPVEIYEDIQSYKKYMDSLGEPIRPSLMDSIKVLEELFLSQQK